MRTFAGRAVVWIAASAAAAFAHFTWVSPGEGAWEPGKTVAVRISHGHQFPQSEEAISTKGVHFFVLAPSGARAALQPAATRGAVTSHYTVKEKGVHRIVLVQDRGVFSRTPKGLQPGGRDQHPNAVQAYRSVRTAVAYTGSGAGSKPVGAEFELCGEHTNGAWRLSLLNQGKPVAGVDVRALLPGSKEGTLVGKTGADGRVVYRAPSGVKGPALFSAEGKATPAAGAKYDSVNYSVSLHVNW